MILSPWPSHYSQKGEKKKRLNNSFMIIIVKINALSEEARAEAVDVLPCSIKFWTFAKKGDLNKIKNWPFVVFSVDHNGECKIPIDPTKLTKFTNIYLI